MPSLGAQVASVIIELLPLHLQFTAIIGAHYNDIITVCVLVLIHFSQFTLPLTAPSFVGTFYSEVSYSPFIVVI